MHPKIVIFVQITLYPGKGRNWPPSDPERAHTRGRGHSGASFGLLKFGLLSIPPFDFQLFEFGLLIFSPTTFPPFDTKSSEIGLKLDFVWEILKIINQSEYF
jgi:hypothetical protein